MTRKIKSAVEVVNKYLIWSVMGRSSVSEEQIELEKSLIFLRDYAEKTSKAWDEVLKELENMREIVWKDIDNDARIVRAIAWDKNELLVKAINIIKQKLSEIEE